MPKIDTKNWTSKKGKAHLLTGQNDGPYSEVVLGEQAGLSQFGVRIEKLPAGSRSSHRHWHKSEDEFVYVLTGELVLIEDTECVLMAGDAAGWQAGVSTAHCLENRSSQDAVILVVGSRSASDIVTYPDHDLVLHKEKGHRKFTRLDGTDVAQDD